MWKRGHYGNQPKGDISLESVQALASGSKVGELFQFDIKDKVDLPRRRSAMLPIINQGIKAEKVSIYNQNVLPKNPLNGAYLTNDTGMKLMGGPITVFDGGSYAGDARMDNLVPGDKRLISYAIDLNMSVDPSVKTNELVVGFKIVRGALEIKRLQTWEQTYTIKNKADQNRVLIVEQPFVAARDLVEPKKFEEKTPTLYRFRVEVPKAEKDKETVVTFQVNEKQELFNAVGKDSELGKRYIKTLSKEEDDIDSINGQIKELTKKIADQKKALEDYLRDLNVE